MKNVLTLLFLSVIAAASYGQCLQYEVPIARRVQAALLIIEAEVADNSSFTDEETGNIFTSNRLNIHKIFKSPAGFNLSELNVITPGGQVGNIVETVRPSLQLATGDYGIFFLTPSTVRQNAYEAYASNQGFIRFDDDGIQAHDVFALYENVETQVYQAITKLTQHPVKTVKQKEALADHSSSVPVINNFSPSVIRAGTNETLTITGSGFGASQSSGKVGFRNADNAGSSFVNPASSEYVSWSDTEIKVKVTSKAGTGTFQVTNNSGQSVTGSNSLTVEYAILNVNNGSVYIPDLVNDNALGGYTFRMSIGLDSTTAAKDAAIRALNTWRCSTFVNFDVGDPTAVNTAASDNINIIRFADAGELPAGVLGVTRNTWLICLNSVAFSDEIDMSFSSDANWNFSTAQSLPGQYDFQSVMLHELGHAHQLGHIINSSGVMHPSISNGVTKRSLASVDVNGGNFVMNGSTSPNACGPTPMLELNSSNCSTAVAYKPSEKPVLIAFPSPGSGSLSIHVSGLTSFALRLFDMQGKMIYSNEVMDASQLFQINLDHLSTGIHLVAVQSDKGTVQQKVMVLR